MNPGSCPKWPQARYCSPACQHAARRWRRWHASQRYRATTHGKQRRRDQARRYRSRRQQRSTGPEPAASTPSSRARATGGRGGATTHDRPADHASPAGEGQRPDGIPENSWGLPCDRPGCYVVFLPTPAFPAASTSVPAPVARRYDASDSGKPGSGGVGGAVAGHYAAVIVDRRPLTPFMSSRIENPLL